MGTRPGISNGLSGLVPVIDNIVFTKNDKSEYDARQPSSFDEMDLSTIYKMYKTLKKKILDYFSMCIFTDNIIIE